MNKAIKNFRDLNIWQKGIEIVQDVYKMVNEFPQRESYGLISQMQRAAVSIPSNIAEGFNRFHNREYRQFLYVALGSCAELETQAEIAFHLGYIKNNHKEVLLEKINHESRMLTKMIKKLN